MDQSTQHPAPGKPPLLAGRYRLGPMLGRGGMADVLRAEDTVLGRAVAVKLFRPEVASAADQRGQSGEIRALARLLHPGLVTLFDAGTDAAGTVGERPFLVMELVDGPSLADRLRAGPLSAELVAELGAQLAEALAYVHSNGVVHRDVKPANILLAGNVPDNAVVAKLTDFGVARLVDTTRLTQVGMTVGTANYLSPEQALGHDVDGATDVYALGLVLLECLTGRPAFPGTGVAAAAARLHRDPELPAQLAGPRRELLAAMTARDPAARPSAAQVAAALRETAPLPAVHFAPADGRPTAVAPATTVLPGEEHPRHRVIWAVMAALAVVAIAIAAVLLTNSPGPGHGTPPARTPAPPTTRVTTTTVAATPSSTPTRTTAPQHPSKAKPPTKPPGKHKGKHKGHGGGP